MIRKTQESEEEGGGKIKNLVMAAFALGIFEFIVRLNSFSHFNLDGSLICWGLRERERKKTKLKTIRKTIFFLKKGEVKACGVRRSPWNFAEG